LNAAAERLKIENIIRYHRPMLEDGEVRYEFFYDPDPKVPTIVHPALDRLVCLVEPSGVKIHWLTDGRWDRTGLSPGNVDPPLTRSVSEGGRSEKLPSKS